MDELNPVQNVRILEEYKRLRSTFARLADLQHVSLKPDEIDQMAMQEAGERYVKSTAGESPEALRAIKPANQAQAERLQRLLHARVGDLASQQQEETAPSPVSGAQDQLAHRLGFGSGQDLQQFGERGAQNIAGLVGGVQRTLGARDAALNTEEFSAANEPSALGGSRVAQTAGDIAGGYSGSYPLALGIEGAIARTPLLGSALAKAGGRLASMVPEAVPGTVGRVVSQLGKGAAQALPKEIAMGETFQGLTGGPSSLTTLQGQENALGMAAAGTGIRGVSALDAPAIAARRAAAGVDTPQARAAKLISDLRGGESGRVLSPEESATLNTSKFGRVGGEQAPLPGAGAAGSVPINADAINTRAPFEEGAAPQGLPPGQYQPQSLDEALAGFYNQPEAAAAVKGEAPEQGAGFRAVQQARGRKLNVGTPAELSRSLNAAQARRSRRAKSK